MSRFQLVADHQSTFEVKRLCQVVQIARSSFYNWLAGAPARAARCSADEALAVRIAAVHAQDAACGAPRITVELKDGVPDGERVNHKRVARVTRERSIAGIRLRRRVRTTIPDPDGQVVSDLLLASVIDCFSRRMVGWSIAEHMRADLVADALLAAAAQCGTLAGAVFHSDHGGQHVAKDYATLCTRLGMTRSMGAVGTSADNAMAESFNATLKRETPAGAHGWTDAATARREVFACITRYNTRRRHSTRGYLSPVTYENNHHAVALTLAA